MWYTGSSWTTGWERWEVYIHRFIQLLWWIHFYYRHRTLAPDLLVYKANTAHITPTLNDIDSSEQYFGDHEHLSLSLYAIESLTYICGLCWLVIGGVSGMNIDYCEVFFFEPLSKTCSVQRPSFSILIPRTWKMADSSRLTPSNERACSLVLALKLTFSLHSNILQWSLDLRRMKTYLSRSVCSVFRCGMISY